MIILKIGVVYILRNHLGGGGSSMITLHVIVTWVSIVKVITEGRGVKIGQQLIM